LKKLRKIKWYPNDRVM